MKFVYVVMKNEYDFDHRGWVTSVARIFTTMNAAQRCVENMPLEKGQLEYVIEERFLFDEE